ncbi:MAG TPA: hypothetical protein VJ729_13360 [Nitrososphaeraceae archaeon]|nr:hypothetical protein [Nitrososphaeraceae archaeon]
MLLPTGGGQLSKDEQRRMADGVEQIQFSLDVILTGQLQMQLKALGQMNACFNGSLCNASILIYSEF